MAPLRPFHNNSTLFNLVPRQPSNRAPPILSVSGGVPRLDNYLRDKPIDWDDRKRFPDPEASLLIASVAFDIADEAGVEAFNKECRANDKFRRAAEWVARVYHRMGKDEMKTPQARRNDTKRAMRLKKAMEQARGICLEDFFVEKRYVRL